MGNLNVEEIMGSLSGEELCKYCRYGIDYDCNGGVRSDGAGNPIYPPCADGLDEDYFDLAAYLADEGVPENCEECKEFDSKDCMKILMLKNVRPDFLFLAKPGTILRSGETYDATVNKCGAIIAICENGETLGVKPGEFRIVEQN